MRLTWGDSEPDSVSLNFSLRGLFVLKISGKFSDRFKFTFLIHYFKENFWSSSFGFLIHRSSLKNIWPKVDQKWNINSLSCFVIETSWIKMDFSQILIQLESKSYQLNHFFEKSLNRARVWILFSIDSGADLKWFDSDHCWGGSQTSISDEKTNREDFKLQESEIWKKYDSFLWLITWSKIEIRSQCHFKM